MIVCKNIFTRNFKIYFPRGKLVSVIIYLWYLTTRIRDCWPQFFYLLNKLNENLVLTVTIFHGLELVLLGRDWGLVKGKDGGHIEEESIEDRNQIQDCLQISKDTSWFLAGPLSQFSSAVLRNQLAFLFHCCHLYFRFFSPSLIFAEKIVYLFYLFPDICVSEVSMLMFLLLVRKRNCSRNKKRSFIWLCHTISFFPEWAFSGAKSCM